MKQLETERLILREWQGSDFEAIHAYASVMENVQYMPFGPNSEEQTNDFLEKSIAKYSDNPMKDYAFAITLKDTSQVIGGCGITMKNDSEAALGWILHRGYWKKGFGTEFAHELIRFGFEELKCHRIYATCIADNYGSYRVMERNNMRREAHFVKNRKHRGEWRDEYIYAILEDEWKQIHG
jgi:RimJ/RimL family protein N-acetyltransferase